MNAIDITIEAIREIKRKRFYDTERGYQGEFSSIIKYLLIDYGIYPNTIVEEEYQKKKLSNIIVRGETGRGNRKFQLDTTNHQVIFKPNKNIKIYCKYEKTKQDKILEKLQKLCELGITYFTIRLKQDYICISFDETILKEKDYVPIKKRICAIDLNPNSLAMT